MRTDNKTEKPRRRAGDVPAPQKLKLLVTVADRRKEEFYLDYLQSFHVNLQTSFAAEGTAKTELLEMLGMAANEKCVLFSVIREEFAQAALEGLAEKFRTLKNGKGIAFTVPLSSTVGVSSYRFLSDNREGGIA